MARPRELPFRRDVRIIIRPWFLIIKGITGCSRTPYKVMCEDDEMDGYAQKVDGRGDLAGRTRKRDKQQSA